MQRPPPLRPARDAGVVLLALLLGLALMGVALLGVSESWVVSRQRATEAELLYVGDQYRLAIQRYYLSTPASLKTYPTQIEDLLADPRFPTPVHHLRRLYRDPVTGEPFVLIRAGANIVGVASASNRSPLKRKHFARAYASFEDKESYSDWKFVFNPTLTSHRASSNVPVRQSAKNQ